MKTLGGINEISGGRRGQTYLWMAYLLAGATVLFFLLIFGVFLVSGVFRIATSDFGMSLSGLVSKTVGTFFVVALFSCPVAFLLTLFLQDSSTSWLRKFTLHCLRESLRCPPVVVGLTTLFVVNRRGVDSLSIGIILAALMIPRLAFGWHKILSDGQVAVKDVGLSLGISPWKIFLHLFLPQHWSRLLEYTLKVFVGLAGMVAPFAYLASFTFMTPGPSTFFSLDAFEELVKSHDQSPLVWLFLVSLTVFTFLFSTFDKKDKRRFTESRDGVYGER